MFLADKKNACYRDDNKGYQTKKGNSDKSQIVHLKCVTRI